MEKLNILSVRMMVDDIVVTIKSTNVNGAELSKKMALLTRKFSIDKDSAIRMVLRTAIFKKGRKK